MNVKRLAIFALVFVAISTIVALWQLRNINFDYEFEDYFPKADTEFAFYDNYRNPYGSDNDYVLLSIEREEGVFNNDFLLTVDSFARALKQVPYVTEVVSPTQLFYPINTAFGYQKVNWFHLNDPARLVDDQARIVQSNELMGNFIATNQKSLRVVVTTEFGLSKNKSDETVQAINALIADYPFEQVRPAGRIYGQQYYIDKMQYELVGFTSISLIIITLFLWFAFRAGWGVLAPLTVVAVSVLWLLGFMTYLGKSFDLMSSLLPTIMFVVGISDAVHIISRYLEELRAVPVKKRALKIAFTQVGKATFLTSVTTAFGFLTLMTSGINPVRDFGIYTAIGVMFAFAITFMLLPAILLLLPLPVKTLERGQSQFWNKVMFGVFKWIVGKPKQVLWISAGITLIAFWGISRVSVNNYLLEDLSAGDPMRKNFEFFEAHYGGARPFEVSIVATDNSSLITLERLRAIAELESLFAEEFELNGLLGINTVMRNLNRAQHGGDSAFYTVPETTQDLKRIKKGLKRAQKSGQLQMVLTPNQDSTRLSAQVKDFGGLGFAARYDRIQPQIDALAEAHNLGIRYTGMAYLIDKNNESLATNLMTSLLVAFGVIALIMGGIFKSVRMVLITLVPNMLPLILIGGVMGMLGIDLKVSTSIIFTIAFGIAVDDTIHYVSKLRMELDKGRSVLYALKRTSISTGKAIVLTSLILISGFVALVFSNFASTFYIGLLVSLTLVFAVLADLFLLPVLIFIFYKEGKD
jgi:predicted RND superfamily exporter protein